MNKQALDFIPMPERRKFLAALPFLAAVPWLAFSQAKPEEGKKPASELLSKEEWEQAKGSPMAQELEKFFGNGYSCAESLWLTALRHMKKPEELVWTAAGFGGGIGQKDACGFLTAGVMAIGMAAGQLLLPRPEAKKICARETKEYWEWFHKLAPTRCAEIRPAGSSGDICRRLGLLATSQVNRVIDRLALP